MPTVEDVSPTLSNASLESSSAVPERPYVVARELRRRDARLRRVAVERHLGIGGRRRVVGAGRLAPADSGPVRCPGRHRRLLRGVDRSRARLRSLARRAQSSLPRRHHGRRPRRHRRLRRNRRLDGAEQRRRNVRRAARRPGGFRLRGGRLARRRHPRFLADITGDGRADIVGFGDAGVYVALSERRRHLRRPALRPQRPRLRGRRLAGRPAPAFARRHHRRRPRRHRRLRRRRRRTSRSATATARFESNSASFSPTSASTPAAGTSTSTRASSPTSPATAAPTSSASATPASTSRSATATAPSHRSQFVIADFGYDAGGWRVDSTPACSPTSPATAAPTSSASATPASTSRSATATAPSVQPQPVIDDFGYDAGGWRVDKHPRFLADITGNGRADIVGFGDAGVYVAFSNGDGTFAPPQFVLADFGYDAGGWRVDKHPRLLADLTATAAPTSSASATPASTSRSRAGRGDFSRRVRAAELRLRAHRARDGRDDRETDDAASGVQATAAHLVACPSVPGIGRQPQLVAPASLPGRRAPRPSSTPQAEPRWRSAATAARRSRTSCRCGEAAFRRSTMSRAAADAAGRLSPPVVYRSATGRSSSPFDAGLHGSRDKSTRCPIAVSAGQSGLRTRRPKVLVVSPRRRSRSSCRTVDARHRVPRSSAATSIQFLGTHGSAGSRYRCRTSACSSAATSSSRRRGQGTATSPFYSPQRATDLRRAPRPDGRVRLASSSTPEASIHPDLHGIFLSPDFEATFEDGKYKHVKGNIWQTSDGGVHWSSDGGKTFGPPRTSPRCRA